MSINIHFSYKKLKSRNDYDPKPGLIILIQSNSKRNLIKEKTI